MATISQLMATIVLAHFGLAPIKKTCATPVLNNILLRNPNFVVVRMYIYIYVCMVFIVLNC
jgi:hypothetical protein